MTPRELTYLKFFTDGNVSLDYLKKIVVRDRILKTDLGKMLDLFPNFLALDGDAKEDIFDSDYLMLPAQEMQKAVTNVIGLIENFIFAQDVPLLNNIASKFEKAVGINEASRIKLKEEADKLAQIRAELETTLLETKKVFAAYEAVKTISASSPDPVLTVMAETEAKINAELEKQSQIKSELEKQALLKAQTEAQAQELSTRLKEQEELNKVRLAEELRLAEIANKKAIEEAMNKERAATASFSPQVSKSTQEKSSNVPLLLGAGLLAAIILGANNE